MQAQTRSYSSTARRTVSLQNRIRDSPSPAECTARKRSDELLPILMKWRLAPGTWSRSMRPKPETEHQMVYLKFLSAACAIGATLAIGVAIRTMAAPTDSRATAVEALKASRLLH